jgi:endonuclease/exonuclease/phosphatase family metal-dependent hydrolase
MPLRIATLNIWNRGGPWEERLLSIRAALAAEDVDVIGLQEVISIEGFDQAALIAEGLGYHVVHGRHSGAGTALGNALLSRFRVVSAQALDLPAEGENQERCLLHAELEAPFGKLPVFVTHLDWRLDEGHVRELQVRAASDAITRLCPAGGDFPPILVGDFNAEPDADEIRFLRGLTSLGGRRRVYYADAFGLSGQGPGATFARRNPFAAVMREPDRRIDYVFVREPDHRGRGEPIEAHVAFDVPHQGVFASDHFGVVANLRT